MPEPQTKYYTVMQEDPAGLAAGDTIVNLTGEPLIVVTDPRRMPLSETVDSDVADLVLGPQPSPLCPDINPDPGYVLVRLTPAGDVTIRGHLRECTAGWRVEEILPVDAVIGPQAAHVRAAVRRAEDALVNASDDDETAGRYEAAFDGAGKNDGAAAVEAAQHALDAAGADGWFWVNGFPFAYGDEILALVARDLIGAPHSAGWNRAAYDLLTGPWLAAFGEPVHPEDTIRQAAA